MKAKYLTAESRDAAEGMAETFFGCGRDELTFEVISGDENSPLWQILAISGSHGEQTNASASYSIYYEDD